MKGLKWRAYSPATSKIAELVGAQPVTVQAAEAVAGARHRRHRFVHVVGRHRLRLQDLRAHQELLRHAGVAAEERGDRQQGGVRRARQADAGRGAEGRRRRRDARLEALRGKERLVPRPAEGEGHDDRASRRRSSRPTCARSATPCWPSGSRRPAPKARRSSTRTRRCDAARMPRRVARTRPRAAALLDRLYDAAAALAALFMVGTAGDGAASASSAALLDFNVPGTDAYAGYCMAGAGFLALAHTLKRGEHIRVTLLLEHCGRRGAARLEIWSLARGVAAGARCSRATACGWPSSRTPSTTSRPATTRRRCGFRSSRWRSARSSSRSRSSTSSCSSGAASASSASSRRGAAQ